MVALSVPHTQSAVRSSVTLCSNSSNPAPHSPRRPLIQLEGDFDNQEVIAGYDETMLSTLMVLCARSGTIFASRSLWYEQAIVFVVFAASYFWTKHLLDTLNLKSHGQSLQFLVDLLTTLGTFLLTFYTSSSLARWWRLRTEGVGSMWSACSQLSLFISMFVTRDERILSALRRYSRASLMLIFMRHRGQLDSLELLSERNLLTNEEVICLKSWHSNLSESIWTWHTAIVMMLYNQGLIKSDYSLWHLFDKINYGRGGAALIGAQLGTPLPVHYVHIIGVMIKLHNLVLAFTYGFKAGLGTTFAFAIMRVFFPVLLYNAVLLINAKLANPFAEHDLAFPQVKFDKTMDGDARSYLDAGANIPSFIGTLKVQGI